jgi:SAM-dependent methyltransferase
VSGFSAKWLALREPFDAAARAADLVGALPPRAPGAALDVVDLGAGTGSNLRYLAPLLGGAQRWLLVDDDASLLALAPGATARWAGDHGARLAVERSTLVISASRFECRVDTRELNLAQDIERLALPRGALVTASALLDLVGDAWLRALAARCRAADAALLFALSYDGRATCRPAEPEDAEVLELFNRHQRTDKGFGAALGPDAARAARGALEELGYRVTERASDWRIAARDREMQLELIDGWAGAAIEMAPDQRDALVAWSRRRHEHVERGRSELVVGHVDLVAAP